MKKIFSVKEAVYSPKNKSLGDVENVEKLNEHKTKEEWPDEDYPFLVNGELPVKINVLVGDEISENVNSMNVAVNREDFKNLFGPNSKPRKGDVLSITGLSKKFKVKKSKKFSAKKKGKGYKLSLKSV